MDVGTSRKKTKVVFNEIMRKINFKIHLRNNTTAMFLVF